MNKKLGLSIVLLIAVGLFVLNGERKPEVSIEAQAHAHARSSAPSERLKDEDSKSAVFPSAPKQTKTVRASELKVRFVESLNKWTASQGDIDMRAKRARLVEELAKNPRYVEASEALTLNPEMARKVFGDQQADARVLAMRILVEDSKHTGAGKLENLARHAATDVAEGRSNNGRGVDLTDLVEGWIRAVGAEKLKEHPHLLSERMVIKRALIVPYLRAFEYVYGNAMNNPDFPVRRAFEEGLDHES